MVAADMVLKPTGDDTGLLVTGAPLIAAVIAAVVVLIRRRPTAATAPAAT